MNNNIDYRWVSLGCLLIIIVIYFPLRIFTSRKKLKIKDSLGLKPVFTDALAGTVFTYLDHLNYENTQVPLNRLSSNSYQRKHSSMGAPSPQKEEKARQMTEEIQGAVLCDCYECFCEGCPWQMQPKWTAYCSEQLEVMSNAFLKKLKYIGYITINILGYYYIGLNNLIIFADSQACVIVFGIIFQTMQFYVLCFSFSFITTKREMVRLEEGIDRGILIYYHLRKAYIFSIMIFIILLILTFIVKEQLKPNHNYFIIYNPFYTLATNIALFLLVRFNKCLRNDLIQDNDNILKAQQKLYALENNLIKYFPSSEEFKTYIDQAQNCEPEIQEEIVNSVLNCKLKEAEQNLQNSLDAVKGQKFKKIKKNLGVKKCKIVTLAIYLYINLIAMVIISALICLENIYKNKDFLTESYNTNIYWILLTLQFTLYPYLNNIMLNKKALFGQDYGEWQLKQ